uniref:Dipeptidyl peptidase 9-like n=1 Tax=Rhizophora mucronata TaxID=61149 RepID=A0A2P2L8R3_RHIMU
MAEKHGHKSSCNTNQTCCWCICNAIGG